LVVAMSKDMNYQQAQQELAETIKAAAAKVKRYFWRLTGDESNSLCRFLGIEESELKTLLRLCRVYTGTKDNLSKNNFELFLNRCGAEWTTFKLLGKMEWFIALGSEGDVVIPKNMYDVDGVLHYAPIDGQHMITMRTKSQKGALPKLLDVATKKDTEVFDNNDDSSKKPSNKQQVGKELSPKGLLMTYVLQLVEEASKSRSGKLSPASQRYLIRLFNAAVDVEAKDLLHAALEKMGSGLFKDPSKATTSTPDKVASVLDERPTFENYVMLLESVATDIDTRRAKIAQKGLEKST
jgi:hypothetical protein